MLSYKSENPRSITYVGLNLFYRYLSTQYFTCNSSEQGQKKISATGEHLHFVIVEISVVRFLWIKAKSLSNETSYGNVYTQENIDEIFCEVDLKWILGTLFFIDFSCNQKS